jgi:hypothetical protein
LKPAEVTRGKRRWPTSSRKLQPVLTGTPKGLVAPSGGIMTALIKSPIAPLRGEPCINAERVDEALHGWQVDILLLQDEFCHIRTKYGYSGYIHKDDLEFHAIWDCEQDLRRIAQNFADVVAQPKVQGDVVATLPRGALVVRESAKNDYDCILMADGQKAYIRSDFLCGEIKILTRQNLVNSAKLYLGSPYRWGGKTPMGIDCSGLTFMAYHLNGVNIWRDAHYKEGYPLKKIEFKEAQPGDLLYFPGHVAMLADEETIIHAAFANGIVMMETISNSRKLLATLLYCASVFPVKSPFTK